MLSKYGDSDAHLSCLSCPLNASATWRRMLSVKDEVEGCMGLLIRNGDSSFWWEDWMLKGNIADYMSFPHKNMRIRDVILDGKVWDKNLLHYLLSLHLVNEKFVNSIFFLVMQRSRNWNLMGSFFSLRPCIMFETALPFFSLGA